MSNEFKKDSWGMKHVDEDGDSIEVQPYRDGLVYIECLDGDDGEGAGAYASAEALIAAIKEVAGIEDAAAKPKESETWTMTGTLKADPETIEMLFGSKPEPEPAGPFVDVEERPLRAFLVTPDSVRALGEGRLFAHPEFDTLRPKFSPYNGYPGGVIVPQDGDEKLAGIGDVIVFSPDGEPRAVSATEFEQRYKVVSA